MTSSAIPQKNAELKEAKASKLKILHRSDLLAELINSQDSIVVAGSHGKTTTSTLMTTIFAEVGLEPTAIIGGIVPCYKSNAYAGKRDFLIAEADESDGSITKYKCDLGVLTNIDFDHTDHYKNIEM